MGLGFLFLDENRKREFDKLMASGRLNWLFVHDVEPGRSHHLCRHRLLARSYDLSLMLRAANLYFASFFSGVFWSLMPRVAGRPVQHDPGRSILYHCRPFRGPGARLV